MTRDDARQWLADAMTRWFVAGRLDDEQLDALRLLAIRAVGEGRPLPLPGSAVVELIDRVRATWVEALAVEWEQHDPLQRDVMWRRAMEFCAAELRERVKGQL